MLPIICIALVLHLGHATGGARVCYGHVEACGSGLLRHGLIFSTAWCTVRLISIEKDWKHVLMQKVVTLNTCCDVACLIFTIGSFQMGWASMLQLVFFWGNVNNQKYVWIICWKWLFGFPKVKWLHLTGEVDRSIRFACKIFSRLYIPKINKIG